MVKLLHDDVIKWKHFPRSWPFVRGIHWASVNSPHKGHWRGALMFLSSAPEPTVEQPLQTLVICCLVLLSTDGKPGNKTVATPLPDPIISLCLSENPARQALIIVSFHREVNCSLSCKPWPTASPSRNMKLQSFFKSATTALATSRN